MSSSDWVEGYKKDFYEIKSKEELEDLKKCLLKELQSEVE